MGVDIADLCLDTDIGVNIKKFRNHNWTPVEIAHYGFLSSVIFFVFLIFPASFLIKLPIILAFISIFLMPLTSQFFVHGLPVLAWLALYFTCGKIPVSWKPAITVKFLPAIETILYGDNLSSVLAAVTNSSLDILAWIPYGILHFSAPFIIAALIFIFGPPTSLRSFGFAFGYVNLLGVIVQVLVPAAPPWYKILHGLEPANYSMKGSPGGLGRIDKILGVDMYTTAFSNSPVIFGAFPSLHSACTVMDALFLSWLFPKLKVLWWFWASWLWWSTMYLTHHYFVDLIAGAVMSFIVFTYTRYKHLPVIVPTNFCRWSYLEIKKVDIQELDPISACNLYVTPSDINLEGQSINMRFLNGSQHNHSTNDYEITSFTRTRQPSRSYVPQDKTVGHLSSSLNLPLMTGEPLLQGAEDLDNSSLEHSSPASVFDGEGDDITHFVSSAASQTSLDETESNSHSKVMQDKSKGGLKNR